MIIEKAKKLHNLNIIRGSLLDQDVDVIVNAANTRLYPGGGIDGALHSIAGEALRDYLQWIYPFGIETGGIAFSPGFGLKQKYVIHTAGPIWKDEDELVKYQLDNCYFRSCYVAHSFGMKSIAFCSISTGIYGYPIDKAIPVAINAIASFVKQYDSNLEITIALYSEEEFNAYQEYYEKLDSESV